MTTKFRYDNKVFETNNTYSIAEQGKLYLLALKNQELVPTDLCVVEITNKRGDVQSWELPKNVEGDGPGSEFPSGTFFYYQISTNEMADLGTGRFECSIRIYNESTGLSRIIMREVLVIN